LTTWSLCMSRSLTLGHDRSVLLSVVAQALLVTFCVQVLLLFFPVMPMMAVSGSPGFYVLDSVLEPIAGVELPKEVFTSRASWMSLIVEWNASANMFYLLKNLLLLILVVFKLKCNNIISMKLWFWMLHMCVYMHYRFLKNQRIRILEDGPLISEVVLSQDIWNLQT
jgi:hypothetical protein